MAESVFITGVEEKYPAEVLQGRMRIEANVVASIWADAMLLDETSLSVKDFLTIDGRFYFSLANHIRKAGYISFDEVTVLSTIADTELEEKYNDRGGWQQIQTFQDVINLQNFDTYVDLLYRENTICRLYDDGFNLLKEVNINNKKIKPIDLFKKMDNASVIDFYEMRLTTYGTSNTSKIMEEEDIDITDEFIESCAEGEEVGVPFDVCGIDVNGDEINGLPFLSRQAMGLLPGTLTMLGGYSSTGKSTLWVTIIMALVYRGEKVLIISNEQKAKAFKVNFMAWLAVKHFRYYKLSKNKILNGNFTEEDREIIRQIQKLWAEEYKGKISFISITDPDIQLVSKKAREYRLKRDFSVVLYDTFKLENTSDDKYYMSLIEDSRTLDKIGKKYDMIMLCSVQLAAHTKGTLFLTEQVLSNAKGIKEQLEELWLMRQVYPAELDEKNPRFYCKPFRMKKINDKWQEEPYHLDPDGVYRFLFPDKLRSGSNSSDTGVAYILKYDGASAVFREVAQGHVQYGSIN